MYNIWVWCLIWKVLLELFQQNKSQKLSYMTLLKTHRSLLCMFLVLSQLASWRTSSIVKCGYQINLGQISLWFMTIECYRNKYCTLANTWNILSSINLFKTFISVTWKNELFITLDLVFQRGKNSKNGAENHYSIDFFCNFQWLTQYTSYDTEIKKNNLKHI